MRSPNTSEVKGQSSHNSLAKNNQSGIENTSSNPTKDRVGSGSQQ